MEKVKLSENRLLLKFPSRKEMTLTMFRLSEFSEGKKGIRGEHFTFDEFVDMYSDEKGDIDFFSVWDGFNLSINTINKFLTKFTWSEITKRESKVLEAIIGMPDSGYIITCVNGDELTVKHELCHAKYHEIQDYRRKVLSILYSLPQSLRDDFKESLKVLGYIDSLIDDEMQAYIIAYDEKEHNEYFPNISYEEIKDYKEKLDNLFEEYI